MKKTVLSINEINPFIRFANYHTVNSSMDVYERAAYDCRLMYVCSGNGRIKIGAEDYSLSKGNLFVWNPGINYKLFVNENSSLVVIIINFDYTCNNKHVNLPIPVSPISAFEPGKIPELCEFNDCQALNSPVYLKNMQEEESSLTQIVNEFQLKSTANILAIRGLFLSLICRIARLASSNNNTNEVNDKIKLIIDFIHENYNKPINNEMISQQFNFHPVYLNRLMVKYTNFSLHQYLLNYRIRQALKLMNTTNKTISEIAFEVGFNNPNYFSAAFKKIIGLSPKKYINGNMDNF